MKVKEGLRMINLRWSSILREATTLYEFLNMLLEGNDGTSRCRDLTCCLRSGVYLRFSGGVPVRRSGRRPPSCPWQSLLRRSKPKRDKISNTKFLIERHFSLHLCQPTYRKFRRCCTLLPAESQALPIALELFSQLGFDRGLSCRVRTVV